MCKSHYFWFENRNWMYYNQITEHIAVNYVKVLNLHNKTHMQVEDEEKVYELENWQKNKRLCS